MFLTWIRMKIFKDASSRHHELNINLTVPLTGNKKNGNSDTDILRADT